ncbi:MAG: radical SAM protein [Candidatus Falkowbacteria bacterium]
MKILLIQPPWYGFQNISSSRVYLGLAYIGAVLEKTGDQILILNGETFFKKITGGEEKITVDEESYHRNLNPEHYVFDDIVKTGLEFKPELIGISLMTANSTAGYILAKKLKKALPGVTLIAGGVHPTLLPEEPIAKGGFDIVVRGEAEETIVELAGALKQNKLLDSIAGISYKKDDKITDNPARPFIKNLDALPFPAFHLVHNLEKQLSSCKGIISSRGCPFECNYCASKLLWTRAVRFRSAANVVAEIKDRHDKLGISNFSFHDDTFTLNKKYVEEFCGLVSALDFKISWHCDTRGDTLDYPLLKKMKKAGCRHIYLGLESGSPKIQKMIKKNLSTDKVKNAVNAARRAGVETTLYFMAGFPEETEEDILLSLKAMQEINPDHTIWSILTPYPGTDIWNLAESKGLVNRNTDWSNYFHHYNQGNIFGGITKETWDRLIVRVFAEQEKQNRRFTIIKFRKKIVVLRDQVRLAAREPKRALTYLKRKIKI